MQINEVLEETFKAMKVKVDYDGEEYIFWVPKTSVRDFDIDDGFAMEKIEGIVSGFHDPE